MDCERHQDAIFDIIRGVDPGIPEADVRRHFESCTTCQQSIPGLASDFVTLNQALVGDPSEAAWKAIDAKILASIREGGKAAPADSNMTMLPAGGETMLGMTKPAAPAAPVDPSMTMMPAGGETMLGMAKPGAAAATPPGETMQLPAGGGQTMLGMGAPKFLSSDELPELPREDGTSMRRKASDFQLISDTDVTLLDGRASTTGATVPGGGALPSATFETMKIDSAETPRGGTSKRGTSTPHSGGTSTGHSAGLASSKATPPECVAAAKDPNRVFGKYILMSELGRGGVGIVYKAWDTTMLQYVALKFIKNQDDAESGSDGSGSSAFDEFQKEARMSLRLRHNNIVRIYEFGSMSNRHYMSMEYIEGGSLLQLIHGKDRGQSTRFHSDPEKYIRIMRDICLAVDYAHNSKPPIIHRDLKPHNVLVDTKGNPYVVDFGLAKEVDNSEGATLSGVVKGTPTYMAPEQADGHNKDVDARTDVYALGTILYEVLTGRPPFLGENVPEILRKVSTELAERPNEAIAKGAAAALARAAVAEGKDPSVSTSKKLLWTKTKPLLVPKPLEVICLKSIEKAKIHRYQSAKELGEDLDRFLKNEDILAQEPGPIRRMRRWIRMHPITSSAIGAMMLIGITIGIVFKVMPQNDDQTREKVIAGFVERGESALKRKDWVKLATETDGLMGQDPLHTKVALFRKALKAQADLVDKTEREWKGHLDRIRSEPLAAVVPDLRKVYGICPELKPKFSESLRQELVLLQRRVLAESRQLVGTGARPAWVEDVIKQGARAALAQAETLIALATDADFKYPTDVEVTEARDGLGRVISYQGTWSLRVNVAPYAEVRLTRADKELAGDYTPLGLQELEVVGSSYVVELFYPSRQDPKVTVRQEIGNLSHGQTVVIRGDVSQDKVTQERQ